MDIIRYKLNCPIRTTDIDFQLKTSDFLFFILNLDNQPLQRGGKKRPILPFLLQIYPHVVASYFDGFQL